MFTAMFLIEVMATNPEVKWILLVTIALVGGIMLGYNMYQRGEQRIKDIEGAKQVAEIRNMISTHKKDVYNKDVSSYEELLKEVTLK